MTKLEAVNQILQAIGEYPVNSLSSGLPLAEIAETKVDELASRHQRSGWFFNWEKKTFQPDGNDEITVASDIVKVEPVYRPDLVVRSSKLFDPKTASTTFTQDVEAWVVRELDWGDLPEEFQTFIAKEGGVEMQRAYLGSEKIDRFARDERNQAWAELHALELENSRYNTNYGTMDMVKTTVRRGVW